MRLDCSWGVDGVRLEWAGVRLEWAGVRLE